MWWAGNSSGSSSSSGDGSGSSGGGGEGGAVFNRCFSSASEDEPLSPGLECL